MYLLYISVVRLDVYFCCCCEVEYRNFMCVVGYKFIVFINIYFFVVIFGLIINLCCNGFV